MYKHLLRLIVDYNGFVDWLHWYFLFQTKKDRNKFCTLQFFSLDFIPCLFFLLYSMDFLPINFPKVCLWFSALAIIQNIFDELKEM